MSRILTALGHLFLILAGYAFAALAASLFLNVVTLWSLGWDAEEMPAVMAGSLFVAVPFLALFISYLAFAPAALAVAVAELFAFRDWLYHAAAGGAVGVAVGLFALPVRQGPAVDAPVAMPSAGTLVVLAAAGIVGGFAYWAVAGRASGAWRGRRAAL